MRARAWICAVVLLGLPALASARQGDAEMQKVADQYQAAFNKGDVKAIVALYTPDAVRLAPDGQLSKGHAAIEKAYVGGFAGPLKDAKLTITVASTTTLSPDVRVIEGRFNTTGTAMPLAGRFVNTLTRKGGQWLLAAVVTQPDLPPAPAKK
jgi:uncharacterized protein (TIGR02246 family)